MVGGRVWRVSVALLNRARAHSSAQPFLLPAPPPSAAGSESNKVPLASVKTSTLCKVIEFMNHHAETKLPEIEKVRRRTGQQGRHGG